MSLVPHSFIVYFAYLTETLTIKGEIDKECVKKTGRWSLWLYRDKRERKRSYLYRRIHEGVLSWI